MPDTTNTMAKPLMEIVEDSPRLSHFRVALESSGYDELLSGSGRITVFAPLDGDFMRATSADSASGSSLRDSLAQLVGMHVMRGELHEIWEDSIVVSTVANQSLTLRRTVRGMEVDGLPVLGHVVGRNGVIYLISSKLEPAVPDTTRSILNPPPTRAES